MNRGEIFSVLQIQETKDKELIRSAYMKKLSVTNPEDNPEGFKLLREAYEEAMRLAEQTEDNSPVGLWIKSVKETYDSFEARLDKWTWEELFEDEVCTDAGTYEDARNALLRFIMDNTYLPQFVFDMLYEVFKIKEDYEELCEGFPRGFMDFVLRGGNGIRVELIKAENGQDADTACNMWFEYRTACTENNDDKKYELVRKYETMPVKMPYFMSDIALLYANDGKTEQSLKILDEISPVIGVDGYISASCAAAYMKLGNVQRAMEICDIVEEKFPGNIQVRIIRADALDQECKYSEAKKLYEDIYGDTNNPTVFDKLQAVNKKLIDKLKAADTAEDKLELGWCYYQNEQNEELMELMDSFKPEEEKDFAMYYNLRSRALLNAERYTEADECITKWRKALDNQVTDNEKDENDRKRRIVLSAFFAARCLRIMADNNNDEALRLKALEKSAETTVCEEKQVLLQLWLERVSILKDLRHLDDAINLCNDIIEKDSGCFPAYIIRQECNFELKNAGAVLDDYHNVMEMVPNLEYGLPYALAAHVFVIYDRYDNAFDIIKRADDNNVKSDYLDYVRASALRYTANSNSDTQKAMDILLPIAEKKENERIDFNRKRSIDLFEEICFGYMDLEQWDKAIEAVDKAIALQPDNVERYRIKLDIYKKSDNTAALNKCITDIKHKFGKNPFVYYEQAKLLEDNNRTKAISLYKQVLKLDEGYKDTNSRLREMYQRNYLDKFDDTSFKNAMEYANKTVELYPYAKQYLERGILYMNAGFASEAEADFMKSVELDDEYILAFEWLGDALRIQGKHDSALKYYEEGYRLAKGNGNYYPPKDYALGCDGAMEYDRAVEILLEMTRDYPKEKFVWITLGNIYKKMHEYDKAYDAFMHYRNEYELSQNQRASVDMDLIELMLLMKDKKNEAFNLLTQTVNEYPKLPEAYVNMAEYYCYYVGDKKLTYKFINKAIELAKTQNNRYEHNRAWRMRNEYSFILGDFAKIKFYKMLGNKPYFDIAAAYKDKRYKKMELYRFALNAYFEGDRTSAFKLFKDMQEGPNCITCGYNICVEAMLGKALMLQEQGKYDEAMECFERVLKENFDPHLINKLIERLKEKM